MTNPEDKTYDVCIIGAGLAGLAATLFAANRGLTCVEVGQIGEINFASGLLDLLGVHPVDEKRNAHGDGQDGRECPDFSRRQGLA